MKPSCTREAFLMQKINPAGAIPLFMPGNPAIKKAG
jgi:hypothetical protein